MIPANQSVALPVEIWHVIYNYLDVCDLVTLHESGHVICQESDSFWKSQLRRFYVEATIDYESCGDKSRDLDSCSRDIFFRLANSHFSRLHNPPLVSSRTSSVFVSQPDERLVRSPFLVDSSNDHVMEVWDFAKMAKFRFDLSLKRACTGVDGASVILESRTGENGDMENHVIRYDYHGHVTHSFQIPFNSNECNIFCTNDNIECTFLVQGLHKFYVNWTQRELNDVGYISAAVNIANGQIYCLLGHSLAICDFFGNFTNLNILFNTDLRSPRWVKSGSKRYLVISQSRGSTRLIYLLDTVDRTYVSWPVESDKRDPDEIQIWGDQVIMWYLERERCLEGRLGPWERGP